MGLKLRADGAPAPDYAHFFIIVSGAGLRLLRFWSRKGIIITAVLTNSSGTEQIRYLKDVCIVLEPL